MSSTWYTAVVHTVQFNLNMVRQEVHRVKSKNGPHDRIKNRNFFTSQLMPCCQYISSISKMNEWHLIWRKGTRYERLKKWRPSIIILTGVNNVKCTQEKKPYATQCHMAVGRIFVTTQQIPVILLLLSVQQINLPRRLKMREICADKKF